MKLLDWLSSPSSPVGKGVEDSKRAASWVRHTLRGNRIAPARACQPGENGCPPVLLIHGYLATRGSLALLERRLADRGHLVLSYRLGLLHTGDIGESAALIARKVESVAAQTGLDHMDMVGHSMGGLVALHYLKRLGGTWSALLGLAAVPLGRASLQLLPESRFLRELAQGALPEGVEIVCVSGERDHLAPGSRSWLAGVRHISLPTNHAGLLVDEQVATVVGEILSAPSETGPNDAGSAAHRH